MTQLCIINRCGHATQFVVKQSDKICRLFTEFDHRPSLIGNVYLGKVSRVLPDLSMAFIDIGQQPLAVLSPIKDLEVYAGQRLLVQVTKGAIGEKGATVSTDIALSSGYLVYRPQHKTAITVSYAISDKSTRSQLKQQLKALYQELALSGTLTARTLSVTADVQTLTHHAKELSRLWQTLLSSKQKTTTKKPICLYQAPSPLLCTLMRYPKALIYTNDQSIGESINAFLMRWLPNFTPAIYDPNIWQAQELDKAFLTALNTKVDLPSGGYLLIEHTQAMTVIDVNTGSSVASKTSDVIYQTNVQAVNEIAHQLVLRNIGGLIVVDLIDMKDPKQQTAIVNHLKKALASDPAHTAISQMGEFGLIAMTRQRQDDSLIQQMTQICPTCQGAGHTKNPETIALTIIKKLLLSPQSTDNVIITAHPTVIAHLQHHEQDTLHQLSKQTAKMVKLSSDPSFHIEHFVINLSPQ